MKASGVRNSVDVDVNIVPQDLHQYQILEQPDDDEHELDTRSARTASIYCKSYCGGDIPTRAALARPWGCCLNRNQSNLEFQRHRV